MAFIQVSWQTKSDVLEKYMAVWSLTLDAWQLQQCQQVDLFKQEVSGQTTQCTQLIFTIVYKVAGFSFKNVLFFFIVKCKRDISASTPSSLAVNQ